MEEQSTAIILARATELRLKIRSSVTTSTAGSEIRDDRFAMDESNGVGSRRSEAAANGEADEEDEEAVRLLNICDALESLENQLSSLQDLQQRQRYEKEAALSEIEHSRKILLGKLKKYKGEALEVIHEASAFVGETVQHNRDFMLPPYPSHPGNGYLHPFPTGLPDAAKNKATKNKATKELNESERKQSKSDFKNSKNGMGSFISVAAKSVVTIVGIVSILHLTGFRPKIVGKVAALKVFNVFRQSAAENNGSLINVCPPGKFLAMENGEARCVVKERIEVPFSSVAAKPDVNYGSG